MTDTDARRPVIKLVVPVFNEEAVLPVTAELFSEKLNELKRTCLISEDSGILYVDDGSSDGTWELIRGLTEKNQSFSGIRLSRNCGHQKALMAGMMEVRGSCDAAVTIDCDGQDDINALDSMIRAYLEGAEIVYGVRSSRDTDTFWKRSAAQGYYRLLSWLGGEVIYNHGDYRLVSARVLEELSRYTEVNLYLRGMFPLIGFKSTCVAYERQKRIKGESRYPVGRMLSLAMDGITSFSIRPVRIITGIGLFFALLSVLLLVYVLASFFSGHVVPGWSSSLCSISMIGGIQLISLGVIGEYIGKIYLETKRRPGYIVESRTDVPDGDVGGVKNEGVPSGNQK